jgi:thioredoxin 1
MTTEIKFFTAEWCGPCSEQKGIMASIDDKTDVSIHQFDIDSDRGMDVANEYNVRSVPTMVLIEDDTVIEQWSGLTREADILEAL